MSILLALPLGVLVGCTLGGSDDNGGSSSGGAGDVSVGAPNPAGAANGGACGSGNDCQSGACQAGACVTAPAGSSGGASSGGPAADPTSSDGAKDGSETDVDCGGGAPTNAPACADGKACGAGSDCTSGVCAGNVCQAPSATDGVKNGDETDVDCGGASTGAPGCAVGKTCAIHGDCSSSACGYDNKCIDAKSCTAHHGGDTCGAGEVAGAHESCCTKLDVPGQGVKMDKYNITAGRMRQFVERTNGNLRGFAQQYTGAWWSHNWDQYLPTQLDNGQVSPDDAPAFSGVYQELGPVVHAPGAQGANEGCDIAGYGARTFRLPDAVNARMGDPQYYTQDQLDERPLNCVPSYMIAAFCAWDGGQMPTRVEWNAAWGAAKYPWGTQAPAGYDQAYGLDPQGTFGRESYGAFQAGPFVSAPFATTDLQLANYNYNYWGPIADVAATDYSIYIAPPGRFPMGNSPSGFADLAGNVFNFQELTAAGPASVNWSKSGSWQGHDIPYPQFASAASNKYWAAGGRCAYAN